MKAKRSVKGWWVICLMAGLGAQPLFAAEAGAVSRAVEVAPPKGWTPDMPLFHDESTAPGREAAAVVTKEEGARAPSPTRAARRLEAAASEGATPVRRTREQRLAERSAATKPEPPVGTKLSASPREPERRARAMASKGSSPKEGRVAKAKEAKPSNKGSALALAPSARSAKVGKPATTSRAAARRGVDHHGDPVSDRSVSGKRLASGAQPASTASARSAKTQRAEATALASRPSLAQRKKGTPAGRELALAGRPSKSRPLATARPGHAAMDGAKAHPAAAGRARERAHQKKAREPALAQRTAKRVSPGIDAGGRATSPGVKKG